MQPLTHRQQQVLEHLQKKIQEHGVPPSIRELGEALKISSLRGVTDHLQALEKKGYLQRRPHARGIRLAVTSGQSAEGRRQSSLTLPLVGQVAAGTPVLAEGNLEGSMVVDPIFAREEDCFVLKVKGDSMIEAGIFDGDFVVVRQQQTADNGDIVVALVGEEATVKRFYREGRRLRLQPENAAMEPIYISPKQASVILLGKVISLLRKVQ
ncbi:MAG: transcriptional repressor LexA [Armatimonadetes bacterium]|nr:transcriptional repressor LexA [Armatimonadota bacterium]